MMEVLVTIVNDWLIAIITKSSFLDSVVDEMQEKDFQTVGSYLTQMWSIVCIKTELMAFYDQSFLLCQSCLFY